MNIKENGIMKDLGWRENCKPYSKISDTCQGVMRTRRDGGW